MFGCSLSQILGKAFVSCPWSDHELISIHQHLPPQARKQLKEVGWTKGIELWVLR